jgi:hypothetical protein
MLLEEAEKQYDKLTKELVDESVSDYAFSISSSLPLLSQSEEVQQPRPPSQKLPEAQEANQPFTQASM